MTYFKQNPELPTFNIMLLNQNEINRSLNLIFHAIQSMQFYEKSQHVPLATAVKFNRV